MNQTQPPGALHRYTIHFSDRLLLGSVGASLYDRREPFGTAVWSVVAHDYEQAKSAAMLERARLEGQSELL